MNQAFQHKRSLTLIYAAFIAGLCSIIYELLIATTAAYFLGDSVKYFSVTIGLYMAAMGLGSYVSQYIEKDLLRWFVIAELMLGLFGGLSVPLLYFAYALDEFFIPVYIALTVIIGFIIGLEIPFLTRLMAEYNQLKFNIANILSFDYLGALIATLLFPFILLPMLGVYQSSLVFGFVNMSIGLVVLWVFAQDIIGARLLKYCTFAGALILLAMIVFSSVFLKFWEQTLYDDRIVHSEQSRYQKIVMTKQRDDLRLFLNGNLQFSSIDEYRYHEALVHVPLLTLKNQHKKTVERVLLLGAGDGLAVRELLKYQSIQEIILVDLDPAITRLAKNNNHIRKLNQNSLDNPKVTIIHQDALSFLKHNTQAFDFIIADLPDPNNTELARLYSQYFYTRIKNNLTAKGVFVTQATSPYFATQAFWCIYKTIQGAGLLAHAYHANIPTFGDWGFIIGHKGENVKSGSIASDSFFKIDSLGYTLGTIPATIPTQYLASNLVPYMFQFEKDIVVPLSDLSVNTIDRPALLDYYLKGWQHYGR